MIVGIIKKIIPDSVYNNLKEKYFHFKHKVFPFYVWDLLNKEMILHKYNCRISSRLNQRRIDNIKKSKNLKLHLGCGKRIFNNWINVDIFTSQEINMQLNFRNPLPFTTESASIIYSEHVLEHLFKFQAQNFLNECYRVLQRNGRIRLGVPDSEIYFNNYVKGNREFFTEINHLGGHKDTLETPIDVINQMFRMNGDHLYAWDFETLEIALKNANFKYITKYESGNASSEEINLDDPQHAFETLYVEAIKD